LIKKISNQFFLFLITGGVAAGCNFFSRVILEKFFTFSTSVILAYLIGMVIAFLLNKFFVFKKSTQDLNKSILFFILINLLGFLQTWFISTSLKSYIFPYLGLVYNSGNIAHIIGIIFPILSSYFGHKKLSFKQRK